MKLAPLSLALLTCALTLSACSKPAPPADGLPAATDQPGTAASAGNESVAGIAPAVQGANENLEYFIVDPGEVFACDGRDRVTSTVKWKVKDPSITTVQLQVDTDTDPQRHTFATEGGSGEAKTENWVVAGVRFYVVDPATHRDLASYEIVNQPCD